MAETMCIVKNRSASMVVYRIPEDGIRREFAPGESKRVRFSELEKLSYQSGGRALMANFLQINDETVTENLNIPTEPEYYMSEEQIVDLIQTGTMDAFMDCLDFAPVGIIDLIKKYAVSLPMNSIEKRQVLKDKTGFDVSRAIEHIEAEKAEDNGTEKIVPATTTTTGRRTTTNYKVVSKADTETK